MSDLGLSIPDIYDHEVINPEIEHTVEIEWTDYEGGENTSSFEVRTNDIIEALSVGIGRLHAKFGHMVNKVIGCMISTD